MCGFAEIDRKHGQHFGVPVAVGIECAVHVLAATDRTFTRGELADGTHLYNAQTFELHRELPTPIAVMAFSRDSKHLWIHDEQQGALVEYAVE